MRVFKSARLSSAMIITAVTLTACGPNDLERELSKEYSALEKRLTEIDTLREKLQERDDVIAGLEGKLNKARLGALPRSSDMAVSKPSSEHAGLSEVREELRQRNAMVELLEQKQYAENQRFVLAFEEHKRELIDARETMQTLYAEAGSMRERLALHERDASAVTDEVNIEKQQLEAVLEDQQNIITQAQADLREAVAQNSDLRLQLTRRDTDLTLLKTRFDEAQQQLATTSLTQDKKINGVQAKLTQRLEEIDRLRKQIAERDQDATKNKPLQQEIATLHAQIKQRDDDGVILKKDVETSRQVADAAQAQQQKSASVQAALDKRGAENKLLKQQLEQRDKNIAALQIKLSHAKGQRVALASNNLREVLNADKAGVDQPHPETAALRDQLLQRNQTINALQGTLVQARQQLASVASGQSDLHVQVGTAADEISRIQSETSNLRSQIGILEQQRSIARQKLTGAVKNVQALRAERDTLKQRLTEALAFAKSVKIKPKTTPSRIAIQKLEITEENSTELANNRLKAELLEARNVIRTQQALLKTGLSDSTRPPVGQIDAGGFKIESSPTPTKTDFAEQQEGHGRATVLTGEERDNDIPWWYNTGPR